MADDFEKRVRKAFRKVGKEAPKGSRNTRLVDQLAERRRRKAERGSLIGRPPKPPRKALVGNKIKNSTSRQGPCHRHRAFSRHGYRRGSGPYGSGAG